MNKRLKELFKEADVIATARDTTGDIVYYDDRLKLFADLIVKECADVCDRQSRMSWNDDRKAQAKLDRDSIKELFAL